MIKEYSKNKNKKDKILFIFKSKNEEKINKYLISNNHNYFSFVTLLEDIYNIKNINMNNFDKDIDKILKNKTNIEKKYILRIVNDFCSNVNVFIPKNNYNKDINSILSLFEEKGYFLFYIKKLYIDLFNYKEEIIYYFKKWNHIFIDNSFKNEVIKNIIKNIIIDKKTFIDNKKIINKFIPKYTKEQKNIKDGIKKYSTIKVNALAGTGKTTTLVYIAKEYFNKKILYLAYNKGIEQEAKLKFPKHNVDICTTHSLALRHIVKFGINKEKLRKEYNVKEIEMFFNINTEEAFEVKNSLNTFYNSNDTIFPINSILDKYAKELFFKMEKGDKDPTHSFYLKLFFIKLFNNEIEIKDYDLLMIDEVQDTNDVTIGIFDNIQADSRIYIGDENQQIYSFRGSVNAMNKIKVEKSFNLTETFRFSQDIADIANLLLNKFLNSSSLIKSKVKYSNQEIKSYKETCFLSRTNSSLIKLIDEYFDNNKTFNLIRKPTEIFSLAIDLHYFINNNKEKIKDNLFLKSFKNLQEIETYLEETEDVELKSALKCAKEYKDKLFSLLKYSLKQFKNNNSSIVFSTAHSSKGLEWDKVIILDDFPKFTELIKKDKYKKIEIFRKKIKFVSSLIVDEFNLFYVAITRAKKKLSILSENKELLNLSDKLINQLLKNKE